jgi:hypothetical protein
MMLQAWSGEGLRGLDYGADMFEGILGLRPRLACLQGLLP